jgi:hypothetical protein
MTDKLHVGWVDEYLFGWTAASAKMVKDDSDGNMSEGGGPGTHSGYVSGYATEEAPDYDEVIHILSREQGVPSEPASGAQSETGSRYRRHSRSRSRSHLDLTALDAAATTVREEEDSLLRRSARGEDDE